MGYGNVPDDWGNYYRECGRCGSTYHASEGGCGCLDDSVQCSADARCRVEAEHVVVWRGQDFCPEHLVCDGCGGYGGERGQWLTPAFGDTERYCPVCEHRYA